MRIPRIYTAQDLSVGSQVQLEESASRHLCQVLRCKAGQPLVLFNGKGGEYPSAIARADQRACLVEIQSFAPNDRESPLSIHLGLGLSKGDRFDWALQKATELGVTRITPLLTERAELRLDPQRLAKKTQHWQRLIQSSCEQALRNRLPELAEPCSWLEWLTQDHPELRLIMHPGAEPVALGQNQRPSAVCVAIGPEGGFSEAECRAAQSAGFRILSLGPRVLRTETAPAAAISLLQWLWGDWGRRETSE